MSRVPEYWFALNVQGRGLGLPLAGLGMNDLPRVSRPGIVLGVQSLVVSLGVGVHAFDWRRAVDLRSSGPESHVPSQGEAEDREWQERGSPGVCHGGVRQERSTQTSFPDCLSEARDFHVFQRGSSRYLLDVARTAVYALGPTEYEQLEALERDPSHGTRLRAEAALGRLRALGAPGKRQQEKFPHLADDFAESSLHARPRSMWILVSQACNLRCHYCYGVDNRYRDSGGLMSKEVVRASVDLLIERSGPRRHLRITFFGGEPALNMAVVRNAVCHARERAEQTGKVFEFSMSTNGLLLQDEDIRFCVENQFAMQFSLDGDRCGHNLHRRDASGGPTYDESLAAIRRYLAACGDQSVPKIRATMTPGNHDPLRIADHFATLGLQYFGIGSSQPCSEPQSPCDLTDEAVDDLDAFFENHLSTILRAARSGEELPKYRPQIRSLASLQRGFRAIVSCGVGRNDTGVDVDGRLYPCHRYVGMEPYVIGDVWSGIDQAAARAYYLDLYTALAQSCKDCWARNLCTGHCPWSRAGRAGEHLPPNPASCRHTKRSLERLFHLYFELRRDCPELLQQLTSGEDPESDRFARSAGTSQGRRDEERSE